MSTSRTDYVMLGVKAPCELLGDDDASREHEDKYSDNAYRSQVTIHHGLTSVFDGMNGEYWVVGKVIAKAVCEDGEGIDITECTTNPSEAELIKALIELQFPAMANLPVKTYVFTHWH